MAMPAIAGPTNRALLNTIELIATADGKDSRSTRFGMSASRAGCATALAAPSTLRKPPVEDAIRTARRGSFFHWTGCGAARHAGKPTFDCYLGCHARGFSGAGRAPRKATGARSLPALARANVTRATPLKD